MKAGVVFAPFDIRYTDMEKPVPKENEVLVKVKYTGICGSDIPRVNGNACHFFPIVLGHEFLLHAEYRLSGKSLTVRYQVDNTGTEPMPFFVGGHPGFNCPLAPGEDYSDYELVFPQKETCTVPTPVTETGLIDMTHRTPFLNDSDTIPLDHALFHKDAVILDAIQSRSITLRSKKSGKGVRVDFADFPYLILWSSANDGPFVALEPWTGLSTCDDEDDVLEHKRNVQMVKPGESKSYQFTITVL